MDPAEECTICNLDHLERESWKPHHRDRSDRLHAEYAASHPNEPHEVDQPRRIAVREPADPKIGTEPVDELTWQALVITCAASFEGQQPEELVPVIEKAYRGLLTIAGARPDWFLRFLAGGGLTSREMADGLIAEVEAIAGDCRERGAVLYAYNAPPGGETREIEEEQLERPLSIVPGGE